MMTLENHSHERQTKEVLTVTSTVVHRTINQEVKKQVVKITLELVARELQRRNRRSKVLNYPVYQWRSTLTLKTMSLRQIANFSLMAQAQVYPEFYGKCSGKQKCGWPR